MSQSNTRQPAKRGRDRGLNWFFLHWFSGPHAAITLDAVTDATGVLEEALRAECEVREGTADRDLGP